MWSNNEQFNFCESCKLGKMHQKSFNTVVHHTTSALHLIHADVWGPAAVLSNEGYKYYLIIVDDYTQYSLIYPLYLKSDVSKVIPQFICMVERQFHKKVSQFQCDMGGEFIALAGYFKQTGIGVRHSCPYTH